MLLGNFVKTSPAIAVATTAKEKVSVQQYPEPSSTFVPVSIKVVTLNALRN